MSALKSPSYRLIRKILARLSVVLESALSGVKENEGNGNDEEDGEPGERQPIELPEIVPFLDPGSLEGLE